MKINNLHVRDDRRQLAVNGIDLTLHEGEILGLAGVDGNGQSELAEAIMNLRRIESGTVALFDADLTNASPAEHHRCGISYVPADRRHVAAVTDLPVSRNAILGNQAKYTKYTGLFDEERIVRDTKELIGRFDIRPRDADYTAGKLSGGNLQKVILGREILRDPKVFIVEQPTRGLDVGAVEAVWREILIQRDMGKAILLISAELEEIFNLSDRVAVIYEGRIMGILTTRDASMEQIGLMMAGASANAGGVDAAVV